MYGIVNQAIQGLVTEHFGEETWQQVKAKSGLQEDLFLNNQPYDDSITYSLAGAAAEVLGIPVHGVLVEFGKYWILTTSQKHYASLMQAGGHHLKEFMVNLPNFHSRVMLMYPELTPPEFKVSAVDENTMEVHYYSQRDGLTGFMEGLLLGLGELYSVPVTVTITAQKANGADHDVFLMQW
ncbi:MAG: heme NO-binding domain-containing protein [Bacteroidota bacterium]